MATSVGGDGDGWMVIIVTVSIWDAGQSCRVASSQNRIFSLRECVSQTSRPERLRSPSPVHRYIGRSPSKWGMVIAEQRPALSLTTESGKAGSNMGFPLRAL
jgi:hypothetical protein